MRNKMVNIFSALCLILERARHFVEKNKRRVFKCLNTNYSLRGRGKKQNKCNWYERLNLTLPMVW